VLTAEIQRVPAEGVDLRRRCLLDGQGNLLLDELPADMLRQIGSQLTLSSGPEAGTEIELSVKGSIAYMKHPARQVGGYFGANLAF